MLSFFSVRNYIDGPASGEDLPEYPTTARVHVETDVCLIPMAYPAYMTSV